jgi:hypothetical protein
VPPPPKKSYGNLVLNKSKPKSTNNSKQHRAKIQTNRWLGLNKFRPKRQKVLQFQVFGLKKSKPKAFHSPYDNLKLWVKKLWQSCSE